jgi:hypothetical protein
MKARYTGKDTCSLFAGKVHDVVHNAEDHLHNVLIEGSRDEILSTVAYMVGSLSYGYSFIEPDSHRLVYGYGEHQCAAKLHIRPACVEHFGKSHVFDLDPQRLCAFHSSVWLPLKSCDERC